MTGNPPPPSSLPPPSGPDPRLTRPLPRSIAVPAILLLLAGVAALLRLYHGSWLRTAEASIAPAIVGLGAYGLWTFERVRARALPRALSAAFFVTLGMAAGGVASAVVPTLGSIRAGIVTGLFWGAVIAAGWNRSRGRPA